MPDMIYCPSLSRLYCNASCVCVFEFIWITEIWSISFTRVLVDSCIVKGNQKQRMERKKSNIFKYFDKSMSPPKMHSLSLNKTFFFLCILRLAQLSLMHLFVKKKKKKSTCIHLSQLNCLEVLPSRTGQMWGLDLQPTAPSLSSLTINLVSIIAAEVASH